MLGDKVKLIMLLVGWGIGIGCWVVLVVICVSFLLLRVGVVVFLVSGILVMVLE